jgi:D-inositol-3-phosphate glycosyltransferase
LRVVVLTTFYRPVIGGVESTAERLARFLVRSGIETRVLTKRVTADLPDREVIDGVQVERIGPAGERDSLGKWRMIPSTVKWLVADKVDHDVVCCVDYRGIGCAALLARLLTRRRVVFQAQTTGVLSGANAEAALGRVGIQAGSLTGRWTKALVTRIYARADAFACISREIEQETRDAGVDDARIHFLPNPVDTQHFRPGGADRARLRADLGVTDDRLIVAFAGRLSREKGLSELLEAWRLLASEGRLATAGGAGPMLLVAGPDMPGHAWNLGESARAFVAEHGLNTSVRFLGPLRDVAPLYRAADIAVVPSHFEALGLSALEALACGVPVVASAVGGLLDFMVDGVNGALCPPQDAPALADKLGALVTEPQLRARTAANARASMVDVYDEAVVLGRFAGLLSRLAVAVRTP